MKNTESSTIRLLIVDDQNLIRQGLKAMLELEADFQVVGDAENGKVALERIAALQPDVVLMDIQMPEMDGQTATKLITQNFPDVKVLILSSFDDKSYIAEAIRSGARGYLLKDIPWHELVSSIRLIDRGYTQFGPGLFEKLLTTSPAAAASKRGIVTRPEANVPKLVELTAREQEVLELIGIGATNREIAEQLYISEGTVKTYVTSLLNRLSLRNRSQLAIYANSALTEKPQQSDNLGKELISKERMKV